MADTSEMVMIVLRWIHLVSGITWIGLLYFFNLVNVPWQKQLDGATKGKVVPTLMPRALWWFRWGAAFTVLAGLLLMNAEVMEMSPNMAMGQAWKDYAMSEMGRTIMVGGLIGIIMFLNVWLIIWPNQKKVIAAVDNSAKTGAPAPKEQAQWARAGFLASRTNFVLSMPMLIMMASAAHLGDFKAALMLGVGATVAGLVWVWYLGQPAKPAAPAAAAPPMK